MLKAFRLTLFLASAAPLLDGQLLPPELTDLLEDTDLLPILPLCDANDDAKNFKLPQTSEDEIETFFKESLSSLGDTDDILSHFEPKTVLCVGCSKGIGRAVACHFASRKGTDKVVSLAASNQLVPVMCPNGGDEKITNLVYDIAREPYKFWIWRRSLTRTLQDAGIKEIDYMLMSAGRDIVGKMRMFEIYDLVSAFLNNVAGHHAVWQEARDFFSPKFTVVMGISSIAAEMRYLGSRSFYHMTKLVLADLILGYAVEEAYVQPNTHYAAIYQGEAATRIGRDKVVIPKHLASSCRAELSRSTLDSNTVLKVIGRSPDDVALNYHKVYAMIAGYRFLNETSGVISRGTIPQTFVVPSSIELVPLRDSQFNNRISKPGEVFDCHVKFFEGDNPLLGLANPFGEPCS